MPSPLRRAAAAAAALLLALSPLSETPAVASPPVPVERFAGMDAYVRERMQATRTPGLAYAVVGPDGPVHARSWGTDGNGEPVTAATPFLWGSVAKPIAASAVMTLVQEGRLRLDDRVADHLPAFRFGGPDHADRVTVRHLLQQTAGLPESATFAVADCVDTDCPDALGRVGALDDLRPLGPPGTRYAYTSANYLVLAALVESVTGRSFAAHLRDSVLRPAGMDGAIADRASARERRLPPGHQLLWGVPSAIVDGVDDDGAAYGYTGGDLNDLAAFAALQLRSGRTADGGGTVLSPDSVRLMRRSGRLQPSGTATGYGLGWRVGGLEAPLDTAVWHTGATPGYSAMILLLPDRDLALVLQQNLHGLLHDSAVMDVGFGAARILAGGTAPEPSSATTYYATVWGLTAPALVLLAEALHSLRLLRRGGSRRIAPTVLWCLAGAAPPAVLVAALVLVGSGALWTWTPDAFTAVCAASVAAAVIALRLGAAVRAGRGGERSGRPVRGGSGHDRADG
ncbi:serine hydrolase domain-containing protein [Streptomyces sp. NPDC058955]|uniref:serine hydrolase domain-containing protein n=1 Tax=unclassified Streptomyces TaxID=2593676 RepID=UPI0036552D26